MGDHLLPIDYNQLLALDKDKKIIEISPKSIPKLYGMRSVIGEI
jgi:hypothetical protein